MRFLLLFCFCLMTTVAQAQINLLQNGDFSQQLTGWEVYRNVQREPPVGGAAVVETNVGSFSHAVRAVASPQAGDPPHALGFKSLTKLPIRQNDKVVLKVWMRSPDSLKASVLFEENKEPWASWASQEFTLSPQWQEFELSGQSPRDFASGEALVSFWVAHGQGTVEVAGVRLSLFPRPELDLQFGHSGGVSSVAYSPDGKTIASAGRDGTVKLWNVATGKLIRTIRVRYNASPVLTVVFSPDGKLIATGCQDSKVDFWNVQTGAREKEFNNVHGWESALAFSPDGRLLASLDLMDDVKTEIIQLRDVQTGELKRTLSDSGAAISLDFSSDGRLLASGSRDGKVRIWDTATGKLNHSLPNGDEAVYGVDISPDGKTIASVSQSPSTHTLRLWNAQSGALLKTMQRETDTGQVAFAPDGKTVVAAGNGMDSWDVQSGQPLQKWAQDKAWIGQLAFSPDGKTLAAGSADTTIDLWDPRTGLQQKSFGFNAVVVAVAVSPDGASFASSHGDQTVRLWDLRTGELRKTIAAPGVDALTFLGDGQRLVTGNRSGTVQLWDVASGNALQKWDENSGTIYALALSPDGKTLASGGKGKVLKLRDATTGTLLRSFEIDDWIHAIAFSPDGRKLACGIQGQQARILDAQSGTVLHTLGGFAWVVSSVAFSPDGQLLATGSWDSQCKVWDVTTGQQLWSQSLGGFKMPVKFSTDGQNLLCGVGGRLVVFEARSGKESRSLLSRGGLIQTLALAPDGRTLITGGEDCIKVWDNVAGRLLASMVTLPPQAALGNNKPLSADAKPLTSDARALTADARPLALDGATSSDYLVVTSDGYYSGSASIDRYIHFKLFDDSYPAECFQSRYYRPDLVKLALSGAAVPAVGDFNGAYPPLATFAVQPDRVMGTSATVTLSTSDDSAVSNVAFLVNGARVEAKTTSTAARPLSADSRTLTADAKALTADARPLVADAKLLPETYKIARSFTATLPLPAGVESVKVQAIAFDDDGLQSPRAEMTFTPAKTAATTGKLLGLCVGVSRYKDARLNLNYADADATALARDFNLQTSLYRPTQVLALTNEGATAAAVTGALDILIAQTSPADTLVISLSGHGWRDAAGKFYFATHEVDRNNVAVTALAWSEVVSRLTRLSEKSKRVIVLLDACHSGSAATNEEMVKAILGANAGVLVFASSRGSEVSLENADWAHGAFTKALLEAAQGLAAPPDDKSISTIDFIAYVSRRVKLLTENQQHPQVPFLQDFDTDSPIMAKP